MSDTPRKNPFSEAVRREAADWFARMRGPDADAARPDFQAWRRSDPAHAEAYERMLQEWDRTAFLASTGLAQQRDLGRITRRPLHLQFAAAASIVVAVTAGMSIYLLQAPSALSAKMLELGVVTADKRRVIVLDDETRVTVSPRSALQLVFDRRTRRARLDRGKVRFDLPHADPRPLMLAAGRTKVIAGTGAFEVSLEPDGVRVNAIAGIVDTASPDGRLPEKRRLAPGEGLLLSDATNLPSLENARTSSDRMLTFDGQTVAEAVARFNRSGTRRIVVDQTFGTRRVSGAFRSDDPVGFAKALVAMFGGRADVAGSGPIIVLSEAAAAKRNG